MIGEEDEENILERNKNMIISSVCVSRAIIRPNWLITFAFEN